MIERIGNCRIIGQIGSGGMAVIYRALQESLNRTVAVKALKTSVAQDSLSAIRFEREALSISSLQHENIIHIYDFHKTDSACFIVMEFVEGIDLYDILEKCPILPADVAAIIALQVARALDYAHYRGIIHRDIKPANIMVAKHGGVKLMDFGIARDQSFVDLTETGTGVGTPSYMSPEQILGDRLDFRSDMFSLGIVLYQMVCGRKPFIEDEHKSVMHRIRLERQPNARRFNSKLPRELERIINRCLEKRKEHRFKSTQDLVLALERFISRQIEINYCARLVLFLRDLQVLTVAEADAQLHPAVAGGYKQPDFERALASTSLRRLATTQGLILTVMAILLAFVHASQLGSRPVEGGGRAVHYGYLRVMAEPWAEVFVDGKHVETTPFSRPLEVSEGEHQVLLKNPFVVAQERKITVAREGTVTIKAQMVAK